MFLVFDAVARDRFVAKFAEFDSDLFGGNSITAGTNDCPIRLARCDSGRDLTNTVA